LRPVFERLPRRVLRGMPVASFDTSYQMSRRLLCGSVEAGSRVAQAGGRHVVVDGFFYSGMRCNGRAKHELGNDDQAQHRLSDLLGTDIYWSFSLNPYTHLSHPFAYPAAEAGGGRQHLIACRLAYAWRNEHAISNHL
jgi:hypothetical protein